MAIFEPLPLPVITNLDPNYFEAFVGLRVQSFVQTADFLDGPMIEIADLAGGDIEAATDAAWYDAAAEAAGLDDAITADELHQAVRNGDGIEQEISAQEQEPGLDAGPDPDANGFASATAGLKGGGLSTTLAGLEDQVRALRDRP